MISKFIKIILAISLLFLNSSCLTQKLWGDKTYYEPINEFLIGQDGRYVVLIGPDYHYVLIDNSKILTTILSLQQNNILTIDSRKTNLSLSSNNDISGHITISGPFSILPIQDAALLNSIGLYPNQNDNLSIELDVTGRRYRARYLGKRFAKTKTVYRIPVSYRESDFITGIGKAAITPIAVGLDAVLLIGKIIVAPLGKRTATHM